MHTPMNILYSNILFIDFSLKEDKLEIQKQRVRELEKQVNMVSFILWNKIYWIVVFKLIGDIFMTEFKYFNYCHSIPNLICVIVC